MLTQAASLRSTRVRAILRASSTELAVVSTKSGPGMLNPPSLVELLPSGVFMANDDYSDRLIAIDPATGALVWQYGITGKPGVLQQAFIDEQAIQCGYCYNGMTIKACELLTKIPQPSEAQIRSAMNGHLCRCGAYPRILKAIQRAAQAAASEGKTEHRQ